MKGTKDVWNLALKKNVKCFNVKNSNDINKPKIPLLYKYYLGIFIALQNTTSLSNLFYKSELIEQKK